ncbi:TIGR02281 family clan AA aspartic protease [Halomonas sp. HP20-15]|uniref:retropepsin-like aspartic protease family protein n=1 Tax=Halomonas sp. HP20-15 TaxID=3085901 RepID=UPI002982ABF5|nr:TIGR02281 family clan AA aspartic protease [Halomonas sp. HP20-15]MDW5376431.1 TIGR02281 family clan AA aspartic protease [Halomonas sp. HP20-15]
MSDDDKALRRTGLGMMLLFWVIVLGLAGWWFQGRLDERRNPNAALATASVDAQPVTLERNAGGHFVATGRINGEPVEFLLDTGASLVSVPASLAERLGLERGDGVSFETANGQARGYLTTLDEIALGGLRASDVRGSINPGIGGDTALLGMSFLNRFDIRIQGSRMILSPPQSTNES